MRHLRSPQFTLHQVFVILKRRKKFLILPPILVTAICILGAIYLPRKYESSTTIWVQKDEILNPLVSFTMAVQMASEDRLQTFEEIVYSRSTIEALLDSLQEQTPRGNAAAWDELVDKTKASIRTDKNGTNSFTIRFVDSDPVRAKKAVELLAELFIDTRLKAEFSRNDYTVKFFEGKLREYEGEYDRSQQSLLSLLRQRSEQMPGGGTSLTTQFETVSDKIKQNDESIRMYQRALENLSLFPSGLKTDEGRLILAELANSDVPFHAELRSLMISYDSVSTRYTPQFPEVLKYENQIVALLDRMRVALRSQISLLTDRQSDLQTSRAEMIRTITESSVSKQVDQETESNFTFYRQLYSEMRVKLEQARIAQELGKNAENAFIIIDPARVPLTPTKPNRKLIILGGFAMGIFLGFLSAIAAELLDTTIRSPKEIEQYRKPIVALLPDVRLHNS